VTVPAGGTASVMVTLDPRVGDTGAYAGQLVATSADGGVVVRTPIGYYKAIPTHRLTVHLKGSNGQPARGLIQAIRIDEFARSADPFIDTIFDLFPDDGEATIDLPEGVYDVAGDIIEQSLTINRVTSALESQVDLTKADADLVFDARRSISLRPPTDQRTDPFSISVSSIWKLGERLAYIRSFLWGHVPDAEVRAIPSRTPPSPGRFTFETHWTFAPPMVSMRPVRDPQGPVYPVYYSVPHAVARLDGRFTLPLVPVGDGDPEDFAGKDVAGKLALVTLKVPATGNPFDYLFPQSEKAIRNGKAAGVKALLFHLDLPGSVIYQPTPVPGVSLPVLSLRYQEGRRLRELLARGPVSLEVDANPTLTSA
jgi:hypothetical protein